MEVPEPRTVIFSGARGILPIRIKGNEPVNRNAAQPGLLRTPRLLRACSARLRLSLGRRLGRHGLVHLDVS